MCAKREHPGPAAPAALGALGEGRVEAAGDDGPVEEAPEPGAAARNAESEAARPVLVLYKEATETAYM